MISAFRVSVIQLSNIFAPRFWVRSRFTSKAKNIQFLKLYRKYRIDLNQNETKLKVLFNRLFINLINNLKKKP